MGKFSPRHAVRNRAWRKAMGMPLLLAFLLGPLLSLLISQATPARAYGWVIECVDFPSKSSENMTDRNLPLEHPGTIAWERYLPLVLKNH